MPAKPQVIAATRLKSFIERIEKLDEDAKAITGDKRDVFAEARGSGFDVKAMRKVLALRKLDAAERDEQQTMLDIYLSALGMDDEGATQSKRLDAAAKLYNQNLSVRDVASMLDVATTEAHRLRKACEVLGMVEPIRSHDSKTREHPDKPDEGDEALPPHDADGVIAPSPAQPGAADGPAITASAVAASPSDAVQAQDSGITLPTVAIAPSVAAGPADAISPAPAGSPTVPDKAPPGPIAADDLAQCREREPSDAIDHSLDIPGFLRGPPKPAAPPGMAA